MVKILSSIGMAVILVFVYFFVYNVFSRVVPNFAVHTHNVIALYYVRAVAFTMFAFSQLRAQYLIWRYNKIKTAWGVFVLPFVILTVAGLFFFIEVYQLANG